MNIIRNNCKHAIIKKYHNRINPYFSLYYMSIYIYIIYTIYYKYYKYNLKKLAQFNE